MAQVGTELFLIGVCGRSLVVEWDLAKIRIRVRFPAPAHMKITLSRVIFICAGEKVLGALLSGNRTAERYEVSRPNRELVPNLKFLTEKF